MPNMIYIIVTIICFILPVIMLINFLIFSIFAEDFKHGNIIIITSILLIIGAFANIELNTICWEKYKICAYKEQFPIYALSDTTKIEGRRYYTKENDVYKYLSDYKDGKKMYSVPTSNCYIVEEENTVPHIEVFQQELSKFDWYFGGGSKEYKIIVPKETITNKFNIDLEK